MSDDGSGLDTKKNALCRLEFSNGRKFFFVMTVEKFNDLADELIACEKRLGEELIAGLGFCAIQDIPTEWVVPAFFE